MRITDELRNWFEHAYNYGTGEKMFEKIPHPWFGWRIDLERMLDRIDKEHEAQVADAFDTRNSDENLEADGWVKLPVDADGVPIHVGDKVTEHEDGHTFTVDGFMRWGSDNLWVFERDGIQAQARGCTHVQPDTWECILEDAIRGDGGNYGCLEERLKATVPSLVARCKALAGEDE